MVVDTCSHIGKLKDAEDENKELIFTCCRVSNRADTDQMYWTITILSSGAIRQPLANGTSSITISS